MPRSKRMQGLSILATVVLAAVTIGGARAERVAPKSESKLGTPAAVERLRAFAKLYGYIRFFHPSDEASAVDWDRLAVYGADKVLAAPTAALRATLDSLFSPIAPTIRIYRTGRAPSPLRPALAEYRGDPQVEVVAWQHRGVGLGAGGKYLSARTHRGTEVQAGGYGFGTIAQSVPAANLRGKEVRLRAAVRAEASRGGQGQLWLRVDRAGKQLGFFDNMSDRPVTAHEWRAYEIVGKVDDDAEQVVFGGFLAGGGKLWLDLFELAVHESDHTWRPVELKNPGFESSASEIAGWSAKSPGYLYHVEGGGAFEGGRSVLIESETISVREPLFEATPALGEVLEKPIGAGLSCAFPVALPSVGGRTQPSVVAETAGQFRSLLSTFDPDAHATARRAGAVVIAWNVLQHFYPYFDVVRADWDAELTRAIRGTLAARSELDFYATLDLMMAALRDGHASVNNQAIATDLDGVPLAFDWIEGAVTVTASRVPEVVPGDVVVSVDGVPALTALERTEARVSGSPQWRRVRALRKFGRGKKDSLARLVLRRDGRAIKVHLVRGTRDIPAEARPDSIARLADGVYYVDLTRAAMPEITPRLGTLAAARGVVFDMRGYPKDSGEEVLQHLTDTPIQSAKWNVPRILYPDRERIAGWDTTGRWSLEPEKPRLGGKVVFLTDAHAISYAESIMGIVEHYRLGEIVGQTTAGTNGNVNVIRLPGGYSVRFTGMKVLKHDGSQHHLVGIRPTVPVARTRAALRAGRDELLERALQLIPG